MTPIFVDTNVFVRHFARDLPDQSALATTFLMRVDAGSIEATITESVLLELEHVLTSRSLPYRLDRGDVVKSMRAILGMGGLRLSSADRFTYDTAVDLYEGYPIDFGDALLVARMRQTGAIEVASFDRHHLDRLPNLKRIDLTAAGHRAL
ncbi:MAG: PIN domain-containing protein [Dehalococcoidia bacterium]|nr:PIN domain-containing protein [Dehalococcoidia bacterium]